MKGKYDVNDFYMKEYICAGCGNICSRKDEICPICGQSDIRSTVICRSCMEYWCCKGEGCNFASHEEITVCPMCGSKTRASEYLIPEDHWALNIPSAAECCGTIRDDDEGVEIARRMVMYAKR